MDGSHVLMLNWRAHSETHRIQICWALAVNDSFILLVNKQCYLTLPISMVYWSGGTVLRACRSAYSQSPAILYVPIIIGCHCHACRSSVPPIVRSFFAPLSSNAIIDRAECLDADKNNERNAHLHHDCRVQWTQCIYLLCGERGSNSNNQSWWNLLNRIIDLANGRFTSINAIPFLICRGKPQHSWGS